MRTKSPSALRCSRICRSQPCWTFKQKKWLREELSRFRKGIKGEEESAYYLDQHFKSGENHVLLHDLRFEFEGDVAQIDHLIINRLGMFYLAETKNDAGSVTINSHGEFTVEYDEDRFGVPSPIEQSRRHERILRKMLDRLEITSRLGTTMDFHHVVMFHPKAIITRPPPSDLDTSNVIKADQFPSWHTKFVDKTMGTGAVLRGLANVRTLDTVKEWGEKLMRQHRPQNQLALPEFMQPSVKPIRAPAATPSPMQPIQVAPVAVQAPSAGEDAGAKRLICLHCNSKISYAEGKYCWNNAVRFKGGQYCREHQALF
jgi:hypothetical protein